MQVSELWRYPVKSLGGQRVERLELEPWGPMGDRRWAVVDMEGRLKTARTVPMMLRLSAQAKPDGMLLSNATGDETLTVATPPGGDVVEINISRQSTAVDAGDEAAEFLSSTLGADYRLVWQPDPSERTINERNGGLDGERLSLADAGPLLLTSTTSLARLQEWVGDTPTIEMARFRPNVVIDGEEPFAEDAWSMVRIGSVDFRVQQLCDRCAMTTVDPETGERTGPEPLASLREHHLIGGMIMFGIRLVPQVAADGADNAVNVRDAIAVGEEVVVH